MSLPEGFWKILLWLTWYIRWQCPSIKTCTFSTNISIDTVSTAITSIIVTPCSIGFIIAETVANQSQWSRTIQIFKADAFRAILCIDVISTAIATIKVTPLIVCSIITLAISDPNWITCATCWLEMYHQLFHQYEIFFWLCKVWNRLDKLDIFFS